MTNSDLRNFTDKEWHAFLMLYRQRRSLDLIEIKEIEQYIKQNPDTCKMCEPYENKIIHKLNEPQAHTISF